MRATSAEVPVSDSTNPQDVAVLSSDAITSISRSIAAQLDPRLHVIGIASSDGESGRVELLVSVEGCDREPCVAMLNVTRLGRKAFDRDLREKFRDALASHLDVPGDNRPAG